MTNPQEEWAQVEVFGHRQHWGRIAEVERFGAKMLRIDVPTGDAGGFESVFYGGAAIFSVTPCTEEAAQAWAERHRRWNAPKPISRLPPPEPTRDEIEAAVFEHGEQLNDGDEGEGLISHG